MTKMEELKCKAKEDLRSAQEEFANICKNYTDKELADLWEVPHYKVSNFRKKLGIHKNTDGSVKKIEKLGRNPFGEMNDRLQCGESEMSFNIKVKYTREEVIKILRRLNIFDDEYIMIDMTIKEGGA